nr:MAG TPA: Putative acetylornithine deacetylase [Caudoviricetes sp.]
MKLVQCNNCLRRFTIPEEYKEQEVEFCCYECCKEYRGY